MYIGEKITLLRNKFSEGNNLKFAELMGETPATTSNWCKAKSLGREVLVKILSKLPEVDANWLLMDKGSMLKNEASSNNYQTGDINTNLQGHFEGPITNQIGSGNMVGVEKARTRTKDSINRTEYEALKQENAALKAEVERLKDDLLAEKERLIKIMLKE